LLGEINGPKAVLHLVKVMDHVDHEVVGPHVPQEPYEAALVELDELLAQPHGVEMTSAPVGRGDEVITRHPDDVLLHQSSLSMDIVDPVRGKQVFQFQSVDATG